MFKWAILDPCPYCGDEDRACLCEPPEHEPEELEDEEEQ